MIYTFNLGLVSLKTDIGLNGHIVLDPVFKWYLSDLKINWEIKATEGITGLISMRALI
jgi:hypothetical protein